jgi:hypothetical protein
MTPRDAGKGNDTMPVSQSVSRFCLHDERRRTPPNGFVTVLFPGFISVHRHLKNFSRRRE